MNLVHQGVQTQIIWHACCISGYFLHSHGHVTSFSLRQLFYHTSHVNIATNTCLQDNDMHQDVQFTQTHWFIIQVLVKGSTPFSILDQQHLGSLLLTWGMASREKKMKKHMGGRGDWDSSGKEEKQRKTESMTCVILWEVRKQNLTPCKIINSDFIWNWSSEEATLCWISPLFIFSFCC